MRLPNFKILSIILSLSLLLIVLPVIQADLASPASNADATVQDQIKPVLNIDIGSSYSFIAPDQTQDSYIFSDYLPKPIPLKVLGLKTTKVKSTTVSKTEVQNSAQFKAASDNEVPFPLPYIKPDEPDPIKLPTFTSNTWRMPFRSGIVIQVHQGYFGKFSHQGVYALDFPSTNHLEIIAARSGTVVEVASGGKWNTWCRSPVECRNKGQVSAGNHIIIQHADGTRAKYYHFMPDTISANVRVGAQIKQGDFLGLMGSTGYTCLTPACTEPDNHLHFEVQSGGGTIPTQFLECVNRANVCDGNGWFIQGNYYMAD